MGLFHSTHIRADGNLTNPIEAKLLHGGDDLAGGGVLAKLPHKSRRHNGNHLITLQDGLNDLKYLTLINNGTKGAGNQTLTAGYTLVLINDSSAVLIGSDCIHAASCCAGALQMDDGIVRASLGALAAADTLIQIDVGAGITDRDGTLGANLFAGTCQTILAVVTDHIPVAGAGMASIGNDIDERRLIVSLSDSGSIHAVGHKAACLNRTDAQTHGKSYTLTGNGTLQKHRLSVQGLVTGHDLIGQILGIGVVTAGIGHSGNLCKHILANIGNQRRDTTHK